MYVSMLVLYSIVGLPSGETEFCNASGELEGLLDMHIYDHSAVIGDFNVAVHRL